MKKKLLGRLVSLLSCFLVWFKRFPSFILDSCQQHLFSFPVHVVVNFVNLSVLALEIETLVTLTSNPCENEAETLMSAGGIWSERAVNNLTSFLVELDLINAKK